MRAEGLGGPLCSGAGVHGTGSAGHRGLDPQAVPYTSLPVGGIQSKNLGFRDKGATSSPGWYYFVHLEKNQASTIHMWVSQMPPELLLCFLLAG